MQDMHEFLLSEEAQFISQEAFQERKQEVLNHFYELRDYLLGEPRGDAAQTDRAYLLKWKVHCKISATVLASSEEEAREMMWEGTYPRCEEHIWPDRLDGSRDDIVVREICSESHSS